LRAATPAELERWDDMVLANPDGGHILQSRVWGDYKRRHGWRPRHTVYDVDGRTIAVLFLTRRFAGFGELWYAPKGPGIGDVGQMRSIVEATAHARPAFVVKWEPELREEGADLATLPGAPLRRALYDIQASKATIIVDLRPSEDDIIASFKPKTRYNVRLAERKGVTVAAVESDERNLDTMFSLMQATRQRAQFLLRPRDYYIDSWRFHEQRGRGQLFLASADGEVIAGAFVTYMGRRSWYKDGGSIRERSSLMAPHLLQWEAMRWLRSRGVESYDLVGVPPRTQMLPTHPLYGLMQFKSGFAEGVVEYVGTWDQPLSARYGAWVRFGEQAFTLFSQRIRKTSLY
jgi:lipid II:glycine glycyltransferase (peptidoglycan interpeptide bridge formation enzyme)